MKLCPAYYIKIHFIHKDFHRLFGDNLVHKVDNSGYYAHRRPYHAALLFTDRNIRAEMCAQG